MIDITLSDLGAIATIAAIVLWAAGHAAKIAPAKLAAIRSQRGRRERPYQ